MAEAATRSLGNFIPVSIHRSVRCCKRSLENSGYRAAPSKAPGPSRSMAVGDGATPSGVWVHLRFRVGEGGQGGARSPARGGPARGVGLAPAVRGALSWRGGE